MPPFELIRDTVVHTMLPAAVIAGFLLWLIHRVGGTKAAFLGAGLAFVVGAAVGQSLQGELRLVSGESPWNRLPWAALIALAVASALRPIRWGHGHGAVYAVVAAGLAWWFLPDGTLKEARWLSGLAVLNIFALWVFLELAASRVPGSDVPRSVSLAFLTSAMVFVHAGSARLMDTSIVLFAAGAGIALVAWWKRLDTSGVVAPSAVLLPGLCLMAQQETFSEISWPGFFLPATAPLLLAGMLLFPRGSARRKRLLGLALVSITLLAAILLAMQAGPLEFE